jgi:acyl carrier protein
VSAPTTRDERTRALLAFLRTIQKPGAPIDDVQDDVSLVEAGLIDSLAVLEIVSYLEATYGLDFAEAGIDPGDLTTIAGILDLIERLQPSA